MTDSCVEKPWRKIAGKNGREKAPEKLQEKTPLKIGVERREVKDERIHGHLEAPLQMLKERHGEGFSFTLMVRHESPTEERDGEVHVVSNDWKLPRVRDILSEVVDRGSLDDPNDQG